MSEETKFPEDFLLNEHGSLKTWKYKNSINLGGFDNVDLCIAYIAATTLTNKKRQRLNSYI